MRRILGALVAIWLLPVLATAQGVESFLPEDQLVASPAYPEPGQSVTVTLEDYASGSFGSAVDWQYDGVSIPDSTNQRSVTVTAGALGQTGVITAVITDREGRVSRLATSITPAYLDIILEPQTRVPDWYAGRGLPSLGSQVNATAWVHTGEPLDPTDLVYTWRVNQTVVNAGPVRGQYKTSFATPRGRTFILTVVASRPTGEVIASRSEQVVSVAPELAFYEQHPLYGAQVRPVTETPLIGNTLTLQAEPFFLDTRVYNSPDVADWTINQRTTSNNSRNPYEITLQRAAAAGSTGLTFHVRSLQEVLQGVEGTVQINF